MIRILYVVTEMLKNDFFSGDTNFGMNFGSLDELVFLEGCCFRWTANIFSVNRLRPDTKFK